MGRVACVEPPEKETLTFLILPQVFCLGAKDDVFSFLFKVFFQPLHGFLQLISDIPTAPEVSPPLTHLLTTFRLKETTKPNFNIFPPASSVTKQAFIIPSHDVSIPQFLHDLLRLLQGTVKLPGTRARGKGRLKPKSPVVREEAGNHGTPKVFYRLRCEHKVDVRPVSHWGGSYGSHTVPQGCLQHYLDEQFRGRIKVSSC